MAEDITKAIMDALNEYTDEITDATKAAVDRTARAVNQEIKNHVFFKQHTGEYVLAFAMKTTAEDKYNKQKTWFVKDPFYRLTHLLEKGHYMARQGGMSKAYPHIQYGEEIAQRMLPELIGEALDKYENH